MNTSVTPARTVRRRRPVLVLLTALVSVLLPATPAAAQDAEIVRLAGQTRIETAIEISRNTFLDGDAAVVVLARSGLFPDALAGAPLAAATRGPLLLTPSELLARATRDEILRVLPVGSVVYLLGGEAAIEPAVATELDELGYEVRRLAGASRYDTALAIAAEAAPDPAFITIADGNTFPDALIAGSLAAAFSDAVVVLTDGETLPSVVETYLDDNADAEFGAVTVGPAAAAARSGVFNVGGSDASERSVVAAETFYGVGADGPGGVALASVEDFPDGLSGGAHAFRSGRVPLLLTPRGDLHARIAAYATGLQPSTPSFVYGGNQAIRERVVDELRAALES